MLSFAGEYSELYDTHLKAITQPAIVRYADYLKAYYRSMLPLPRYKWPQSPSKKPFNIRLLEESASSVSILNEDPVPFKDAQPFTRGGVISLHYLMKPLDGSDKIGCVFLKGVPGVGKSCLAVELCRHWKNIESLKKYPMVILIKAQDKTAQDAKTLADLFVHHNVNLNHAVAEEVAASEGCGVMLILDGLDQVPLSPSHSPLLLEILQGKVIPQAALLVTTRTDAAPYLLSLCKRRVDRLTELVGFTRDEVEQHAESVLGYDSSLLSGFHEYISANPVICNTLHVPLNTAIAVEVYKEARSSGDPCSKSLTQLYQELTKHLLCYHLLLQGAVANEYELPTELEKLPMKAYNQFASLTKQAFTALVNQETSWTRLFKTQYHLGFMIGVPELYLQKRITLTYNYLHLHVQELLAAFHIKNLPALEQTELYQKHFSTPCFGNVWKFLAGFDKFQSPFWDDLKSAARQDGSLNLFLLHCLYEVYQDVPIEAFLNQAEFTFPQSKLGEEVTTLDCYRLGCCLAHSSCCVNLRQRLNADMLHHLALGLQTKEEIKSSIRTLFLRPPVTAEMIQTLKSLPSHLIEGLDVSHCDLDKATTESLASVIPNLTSLKELDIRGNPGIGEGGMVKVLSALTSLDSLESLNVINTGMRCVDIKALTPLLSQPGHLRTLTVGEEDQPDICVCSLLQTTFTSSSLHSLHIWLTNLEPHVTDIRSLLTVGSTTMKTLEFHGCKIGQEGCCQIAEGLIDNCTLTRVVFSMFDVLMCHQLSTEGAMALAEMLEVNKTLESLEISFDRTIGRKGALALMCSLEHNKKLHSLKLPQQNFSLSDISVMDSRLEWV